MLLFIYFCKGINKFLCRFNTSHVTLYLYSSPNNVGSSGVSIHLMLLFIGLFKVDLVSNAQFQYISCYSLSLAWFVILQICDVSIHLMLLFIGWFVLSNPSSINVSIHLMLLFIRMLNQFTVHSPCVSIHLMLLFILQGLYVALIVHSFNTSHVTLYPSHNTFTLS